MALENKELTQANYPKHLHKEIARMKEDNTTEEEGKHKKTEHGKTLSEQEIKS